MCNCKKTKVEAPPPIPVEVQEHFIKELDEFNKEPQTKEQYQDDELKKWNGGNYPLIED